MEVEKKNHSFSVLDYQFENFRVLKQRKTHFRTKNSPKFQSNKKKLRTICSVGSNVDTELGAQTEHVTHSTEKKRP